MIRQLIALLCASAAAADYVVDWRVPHGFGSRNAEIKRIAARGVDVLLPIVYASGRCGITQTIFGFQSLNAAAHLEAGHGGGGVGAGRAC